MLAAGAMESKINLAQVAPVNYKVTAALVNQFVVSTTQFLNRFGTRCDRKLQLVASSMHRIEVPNSAARAPALPCVATDGCAVGCLRADDAQYSGGETRQHWKHPRFCGSAPCGAGSASARSEPRGAGSTRRHTA